MISNHKELFFLFWFNVIFVVGYQKDKDFLLLLFIYLFMYLCIYLYRFIYLFIYLFIHSFIHSLIHFNSCNEKFDFFGIISALNKNMKHCKPTNTFEIS